VNHNPYSLRGNFYIFLGHIFFSQNIFCSLNGTYYSTKKRQSVPRWDSGPTSPNLRLSTVNRESEAYQHTIGHFLCLRWSPLALTNWEEYQAGTTASRTIDPIELRHIIRETHLEKIILATTLRLNLTPSSRYLSSMDEEQEVIWFIVGWVNRAGNLDYWR